MKMKVDDANGVLQTMSQGRPLQRPAERVQSAGFGQSGVALVLSLLILLVLTIVGVAAMNSTVMQERMAGNTRTQTQTFEMASEGVSRALDYFFENADDVDASIGHDYGLLCGFVHSEGPDDAFPNSEVWSVPANGFETVKTTEGGLRLEQRMYCCQNWTEENIDGNLRWLENPSKLFVLSRGTQLTGQQAVSRREVEVRLTEAEPADPTCALCVPGEVGDVEAANSAKFRMHGSCGPAITTEHPEGAVTFQDAIKDTNKGNYEGGITSGDMGSPWNDPNFLAEFVYWAKLGLPHKNETADDSGYWEAGDLGDMPNAPQFGTEANPAITYIDGNLYVAGNTKEGGHGILIVRGGLEWRGTPEYQGLILVLGGDFKVSGGGSGGDPLGSLVVTNLLNEYGYDLGGRQELVYPIAEDDGQVHLFDENDGFAGGSDVRKAIAGGYGSYGSPNEDKVPSLPLLRDSDGRNLIYYFDPDGTLPNEDRHRFFLHDAWGPYGKGDEIDSAHISILPGNVFQFLNPADPTWVAQLSPQPDHPPRDKFGRLIPNFVPLPSWPGNWLPDQYEYDPNLWGWACNDAEIQGGGECVFDHSDFASPPPSGPFAFGSSNFDWSGGGGQSFTYSCQYLQEVRHRLLCETKDPGADPDLPDGYDFKNPDPGVCQHPAANTDYNVDLLNHNSGIDNQHSWHLWNPSCDCLGVTGDTDMIIAGWRENLGWRDDEFQGCSGLAAPP